MREITCAGGTRWRIEAVAEAPADGDAGGAKRGADGEVEVTLLRCVTCDGPAQYVTIRTPGAHWRELPPEELCRLIEEAEASGVATE